MEIKNLLFILILFISFSGAKAQKGLINITKYPDTIRFSDTLMIEVFSHVRDNGTPCSPLTSVTDTFIGDSLCFNLTFDFTGTCTAMCSCSRKDTLYYPSLPQQDSIVLTCYYSYVDSTTPPPVLVSRLDTTAVVIHIVNTTSIKELKNNNTFHIYPNPSNGLIKLNFKNEMVGDYTMKVFDLLGHVVHTENSINKKIDLRHLGKGIYLLSLGNGNESLTKKLVLK